jgi:hypothetical protein
MGDAPKILFLAGALRWRSNYEVQQRLKAAGWPGQEAFGAQME